MPRKPAEYSQLKLRLRHAERNALEIAAARNGTTLNGEIGARIRSREMLDVWWLTQEVNRFLGPLVDNAHELMKNNELQGAANEIIALVRAAGPVSAEMEAAITRYDKVKIMIASDFASRARQVRLPGGTQP